MSDIIRYEAKEKDIVIIIDRDLCKGCDICVQVCKQDGLKLVDAPDKWEGASVEMINPELCNFCKLCEIQCPDFAIRVLRKDEEGTITIGKSKKTSAEQ
ncbi:MAG: 4Fe-4S binding protein [bacterium]|nr:4Fe-4S binding protein [bacterium]